MASKFVRANSRVVLIAAGTVFLLLAIRDAWWAEAMANKYQLPLGILSGVVVRDAIFGVALLFVAIRKSQFAGAAAVIIATFLIFSVALRAFMSQAFTSTDWSWWSALNLAFAFAILWPSLFPWNSSANRPAFFWMALTFGVLTLLLGSLALLARL